MNTPRPIICVYDGEAFRPSTLYQSRLASEQYGAGEIVALVRHEDRSDRSHRHYFAAINEAWQSLPDELAALYPTPEHLRKVALIRAGYADEKTLVCSSRAEALRLAAFVRPMDSYAIVAVSQATVKAWTAQSQSTRAMGRKAFQESKDKVLDWIAAQIGVTRDQLPQEQSA